MARKQSEAMAKAERHYKVMKKIGVWVSASELGKKFGLNPSSFYRSAWWRAEIEEKKEKLDV